MDVKKHKEMNILALGTEQIFELTYSDNFPTERVSHVARVTRPLWRRHIRVLQHPSRVDGLRADGFDVGTLTPCHPL